MDRSGRPLRADTMTVVATNTIHLDASHPSHIVLPVTTGTTAVNWPDQHKATPMNFALGQNYPNPVTNDTQISYSLSRPATIRISLFNMLGQEIRTLADGLVMPGAHMIRWDGRDENGRPVAQGIYFYRLEAGDFAATRKLMVLREGT